MIKLNVLDVLVICQIAWLVQYHVTKGEINEFKHRRSKYSQLPKNGKLALVGYNLLSRDCLI